MPTNLQRRRGHSGVPPRPSPFLPQFIPLYCASCASYLCRFFFIGILVYYLWQYGEFIRKEVEMAKPDASATSSTHLRVEDVAKAWVQKAHRKFDRILARSGRTYKMCDTLDELKMQLLQEEGSKDLYIQKYKTANPPLHCGRMRVSGDYFGLGKKHYELWQDCSAEVLPAKRRMIEYLDELCQNQRAAIESIHKFVEHIDPHVNHAKGFRGIVYTGKASHLKNIYQSISGHALFGVHLPVEVFVNSHTLSLCKYALENRFKKQVQCKGFPDSVKGFASKFHALLLSSFTEVLFMDADNMIVDNVNKIFDSEEFKEHGMVMWPDMWGERCRPIHPSLDNGFVSFKSHVLWAANIGGLTWELNRNIAQEAETGQLAIDLSRHGGLLNLGLKLISDDAFFKRVVNGDKDIFRLSHLLTQTPFYYVPHIPAYSVPGADGSGLRDCLVQYFGSEEGKPMFFHQLKTRNPEAFMHALRAPMSVRHFASVCADSRLRTAAGTRPISDIRETESAEMENPVLPSLVVEDLQDGKTLRDTAEQLFTKVDAEWSAIASTFFFAFSMVRVTLTSWM